MVGLPITSDQLVAEAATSNTEYDTFSIVERNKRGKTSFIRSTERAKEL
jgi:hypothetical protein